MSEEITQPTITPEMLAAYQRQQTAAEEQRRRELLRDLVELARQRGYRIAAGALLTDDGRLTADWGVVNL